MMPTYQGKMLLPDISATMHIWWYCSGVTMAPASGEENKTRKCLGQFHATYYQIWQPFFPTPPLCNKTEPERIPKPKGIANY